MAIASSLRAGRFGAGSLGIGSLDPGTFTMTGPADRSVDTIDPDWGTLQRVAEGDPESFGLLVDRHQQRLQRLCLGLLHDPEEARDAVQEVFLKAYRKAPKYRPRGRVYTWLYRIAVNHCLNRLRRRRIVRFLTFGDLADDDQDTGATFDPVDDRATPDRHLAGRDRWRATRRRIAKLPPNQKAVLVLAKLEGMSYREVAQTLGITEGAVESRLFRAMRNLEKETPR